MNILFVTRKYPPSVGGMELFASDLYEALSQKENVLLVKYGGPRLLSVPMLPLLWLRASYILATKKVDIVHIADGLQAPIGITVAKLFRKKSVITVHGLDLTWPKRAYQLIVPPFVKRADRVICISREVYNEATSRGISKTRAVFIPLAVKDDIYGKMTKAESRNLLSISKDSVVLLSVGRLVKRKGIAWFIDNVMSKIALKYPELILLVVGIGDDQSNIEAAIKKNLLEKHVILAGRVSGEDRLAAYNASDIFIMPNISVSGDMEGFGLVNLEAAAAALPVVASELEGIKDAVVNGKNGILVEPSNAEQFSVELAKLIENKSDRASLGQKAREYTLENYRLDKVANKVIEQYNELL